MEWLSRRTGWNLSFFVIIIHPVTGLIFRIVHSFFAFRINELSAPYITRSLPCKIKLTRIYREQPGMPVIPVLHKLFSNILYINLFWLFAFMKDIRSGDLLHDCTAHAGYYRRWVCAAQL